MVDAKLINKGFKIADLVNYAFYRHVLPEADLEYEESLKGIKGTTGENLFDVLLDIQEA